MARIFISYSRKDESFARRLATSLSQLGADIWIDLEDIPAGMKWSSAIQQGLDTGDILIVIISPDSMASRNVEDEWQYYLDNGKAVVPVLLHPAKIHFQLNRIQYIDFQRQDYNLALRQLHGELARKGVRLNQISPDPALAYQPSPHHYPTRQPAPPPRRNWLPLAVVAGVGVLALVAVGLLAAALTLINNMRPQNNTAATLPSEVTNPPISPTTLPTALEPTLQLGLPDNPVTNNASWSPLTRNIGGVDMVLVPAGSFTMGSNSAQIDAARQQCTLVLNQCSRVLFEDEAPQERISFSQPFWIDRLEVTNGQYGSSGTFTGNDYPRTNITWRDAQQHCQNRGARLPTEAEWEYAARGPDNLIYPWGNQFDGSRLNFCDGSCGISNASWRDTTVNDYFPNTAPVGSFPVGASWVGALDMSGNVWEWTSTIYGFPYPYRVDDGRENTADTNSKRVLRGGSWNWIAADARTTSRDDYAENSEIRYESSDWYGFRCARDFQSGDLT